MSPMIVMPTSYFLRKQALRLTAKGRWMEARAAWRRLLAVRGARASDYVRFARAVERNEDQGAAVEAYQAAARRFPIDPNVQRQRGLHLLRLHRDAEACLAFARARVLSPADNVLRRDLAALSIEPSQERGVAMRAFKDGLDPTPSAEGRFEKFLAKGTLHKAQRAGRVGDWAGSARLYRKVLAQRPGYAYGYLRLGHALREIQDLKGAEAAYWRAVALTGRKVEPFLHLGHTLKLAGDNEASLAAYLVAWTIEPARAEVKAELQALGYAGADPERLAEGFWGRETSTESLALTGGGRGRAAGGLRSAPLPLEVQLKEKAVRADLARMLGVGAR